jgi:hypothetical protein
LTRAPAPTIINEVLERLRAAIVGLSLVPGIALSAALPMEHWHEAGEHHAHATIHTHIDAQGRDGAEVSPTEGRVTWADHVAVQEIGFRFVTPALLPSASAVDLDRPTHWVALESADSAPSHGPPRPDRSLRGPPERPAFFV